jgi:hypothetical protein
MTWPMAMTHWQSASGHFLKLDSTLRGSAPQGKFFSPSWIIGHGGCEAADGADDPNCAANGRKVPY